MDDEQERQVKGVRLTTTGGLVLWEGATSRPSLFKNDVIASATGASFGEELLMEDDGQRLGIHRRVISLEGLRS